MKLSLFNNPKQPNPSKEQSDGRIGTSGDLSYSKRKPSDSANISKEIPNVSNSDTTAGTATAEDPSAGILQNQILNCLFLVTVSGDNHFCFRSSRVDTEYTMAGDWRMVLLFSP
jgi:hypothetical protein